MTAYHSYYDNNPFSQAVSGKSEAAYGCNPTLNNKILDNRNL